MAVLVALAQVEYWLAAMKRGYLLLRGERLVILCLCLALCILIGEMLLVPSLAQSGQYQWSMAVNVSTTTVGSWFPDLAVDSAGIVHVAWCETVRPETWQVSDERVYYAFGKGQEWSKPNDIVPSSPDVNRNALAVDRMDNLYLTFRYGVTGGIGVKFMRAAATQARSAAAWTTPHRVDVRGNAYMSDLAIDSQGVMHLILDDGGASESRICPAGCADIYYRRSEDQGQTWSYPINLSLSPVGSSREQIEVDGSDAIHVTWDEGWDRVSGIGEPISSSYTLSTDGGRTWSPVTSVTYPDSTVAQLAVGSDGQGGVMLVWRATSGNEIYYQWSADWGRSWGTPAAIPSIFARPWDTPFDMYDMATDSAGLVHLLVAGRKSQEAEALVGIYHLVWDGDRWLPPTGVFAVPGLYPEYPKIVIHEGNQLHAVWFTREGSMWDVKVNREVWYSNTQSPAPHQPVMPWPTLPPTPEPSPAIPSPVPTATPYPTISPEDIGLPGGVYTEGDDVFRLAIALLPVVLVVLAVIMVRKFGAGRSRW